MDETKHTCIDALIDVEDDQSWLEAMESKKDCPACAIRYGAEAIAKMIAEAKKEREDFELWQSTK